MALMKEATYKFHEAGGLLINGTDSPGAALPGWSAHQEMELFVEAGLTPMAALQTTTLNNAKVLGKEDELGTVEAGRLAYLAGQTTAPTSLLDETLGTQETTETFTPAPTFEPSELPELPELPTELDDAENQTSEE